MQKWTERQPLARRKLRQWMIQRAEPEAGVPIFTSLDAFRPLGERAPDPQIAEAQRREFFNQLHRWLRQGYAVHVFCNNDGERQRFEEIWEELGLGQASRPWSAAGQRSNCRLWTVGPVDSHRHARRADFFATRPSWLSSPTRKFLAATKFSGRAG